MNPPLLRIDKEGRWFFGAEEITHRKTYLLYCRHLTRDPDGGYRIRIGAEESPVQVEDTPFVVRSLDVERSPKGELQAVRLILNDETVEPLKPETLRIGPENVPYCRIRNGFEARFSRPAYQLLIPHIRRDRKGFFLRLNGKRYPLAG